MIGQLHTIVWLSEQDMNNNNINRTATNVESQTLIETQVKEIKNVVTAKRKVILGLGMSALIGYPKEEFGPEIIDTQVTLNGLRGCTYIFMYL